MIKVKFLKLGKEVDVVIMNTEAYKSKMNQISVNKAKFKTEE